MNKGPIEVTSSRLSSGGGGGGGGNGGETPQEEKLPEIKEAKATPTAPPPSRPNRIPKQKMMSTKSLRRHQRIPPLPADTNSGDSTSEGSASSGTGGGTGGGNGTGNGPGDGSGEGPGSGSGSGGGNGSGYGSGNGDGAGPGDGVTMGPQLLSNPAPAYPESCRKANISGTTVVGLTISSDGSVSSAWVVSSSGNGTLDSAAVNAVYGWQFVPAKQNGVAITCNSQVPVTFNLR